MISVDFLGIGAQKCATTWFYRQLSRHPQCAFPKGKEFHYWDGAPKPNADEWVSELQPESRTSGDGRRIVTGEITPAYAILPDDRIRMIRSRCGGLRIFMSLRNPIERSWSAALMDLARAGIVQERVGDHWFLEHARSSASRARSDYASCLERWWACFPRDQVLLVFTEDVAERPERVLLDLAAHLGIDSSDFARLPATSIQATVRPELTKGMPAPEAPPLRASLFEPLLGIHMDSVERLSRLVERDISHWLQPPQPRTLPGPRVTLPVTSA